MMLALTVHLLCGFLWIPSCLWISLFIGKSLDVDRGLEQIDLWVQPLNQHRRSSVSQVASILWAVLSVTQWGELSL